MLKPWDNPKDPIDLFANNISHSNPEVLPVVPLWQMIIPATGIQYVVDLGLMAQDRFKAASLVLTPSLKPFGEGRALFSCRTSSQSGNGG